MPWIWKVYHYLFIYLCMPIKYNSKVYRAAVYIYSQTDGWNMEDGHYCTIILWVRLN